VEKFEDSECPLSYRNGLRYGSKDPCNFALFTFVTVLVAAVVWGLVAIASLCCGAHGYVLCVVIIM
jgi:hypothetical protein